MRKVLAVIFAVLMLTACESTRTIVDNPQMVTLDTRHFANRHGCRFWYRAFSDTGREYKLFSNTLYKAGTRVMVCNGSVVYTVNR